MIHLILGGARSGKSRYAEELAKNFTDVSYVATAIAFDSSMEDRIKRHQEQRPKTWQTIEQWKAFDQEFETECVLVDCLTLLVSNHLLEAGEIERLSIEEIDEIEQAVFNTVDELLLAAKGKELILVSNEVGMGLAPPYVLGNIFRDIAGRVNQYLAQKSDKVVLMVAGLPMIIKDNQ